MAPFPDWAGVVIDVLLLILQRLPVPDVLSCEAVCIAWSAAVRRLRLRSSTIPLLRQPPWLFISICSSDGSRTKEISNAAVKFYSLVESRFYTVHLRMNPPIRRCICVGANDGWLIIAECSGDLSLLNPITGARITNIPHTSTIDTGGPMGIPGDNIVCKAAMSRSPLDGNWVVMVISSLDRRLCYARTGDTKWTALPLGFTITDTEIIVDENLYYVDVVQHERLFYALNMKGVIEIWDFKMSSPHGLPVMNSRSSLQCCLVSGFPQHTIQFHIEIIDDSNFKFRWIFKVHKNDDEGEVTSLGNHAILAGSNGAIYISSADFPEIKSNCIYYADNMMKVYGYPKEDIIEIHAHNLEDESIVIACPPFSSNCQASPTWLTPSFN